MPEKRNSPPPISADQAEKILRAELTSLATASKRFVANQVELASALGVSRKTIARRLKSPGHPGTSADGRYEVAAWREFLSGMGTIETEDITALKEKNLALQNEKLKFQLGILRKSYVPAELVEKWGAQLGHAIKKVVSGLHLSAPNLAGLSVVEISDALKKQEAEILSQMHTLKDDTETWLREVDVPTVDPQ